MGHDDDDGNIFPRRKSDYDLRSKMMLTALASFSCVVLLVTILLLYARCVLHRRAHRRVNLQGLGFTVSSSTNTEPPKTGLDPSVVASLPIFSFKPDDESGLVECSVCLSTLEEGERARTLPNCKHTFHAECIDKWFSSNSTCPICRVDAQPSIVAEPGQLPPSAPPVDALSSSMERPSSDGGGLETSSAKTNSTSSQSEFV